MSNEELQNNEPVSRLLGELKHVEAPSDFDFGVRARIAAGRPTEKGGFRIPVWLAYGAPLALVLAVGGYFALNSFYSVGDANVPVVAVNEKPNVTPPLPAPSSEVALAPPVTKPDEQLVVKKPGVVSDSTVVAVKKPVAKDKNTGGGSIDLASRVGRRFHATPQIPAKTVLDLIGAKGSFEADGWRVQSTTPNSLAERSQIQTGDVIESVNGQTVTDKSTLRSNTPLKTVRVRRDGKSVDIVIKN
ncbi:MAG: PDZ domain-containing protein [Chloracidobacterium sp.]|nr:PDZ domain-containing protein [Chloracidobacterium sp.]